LGEVRPGKYSVVIDKETLPPGFEVDFGSQEIEVLSGLEPVDVEDISFSGVYAEAPEVPEEEPVEVEGIEYKTFD
jgi:hypothetical protein